MLIWLLERLTTDSFSSKLFTYELSYAYCLVFFELSNIFYKSRLLIESEEPNFFDYIPTFCFISSNYSLWKVSFSFIIKFKSEYFSVLTSFFNSFWYDLILSINFYILYFNIVSQERSSLIMVQFLFYYISLFIGNFLHISNLFKFNLFHPHIPMFSTIFTPWIEII